jgi:hypothetical protein
MRPTFITVVATSSAALWLYGCGGEMPPPSSAEILVTYSTKLPTGVEQWSSCTNNGIGQVACETDAAEVPNDDEWTCTACDEEAVEQAKAAEPASNLVQAEVAEPASVPTPADPIPLQSEGSVLGSVKTALAKYHHDKRELPEAAEGVAKTGAVDKDADTDSADEAEACVAAGEECRESSDERESCLNLGKARLPLRNSLAAFLEGLEAFTQCSRAKGDYERSRAVDMSERASAELEQSDKPIAHHTLQEKADDDAKETGARTAKTTFDRNRAGALWGHLTAQFPKRASTRTTCIRSGLPTGAFDCKAAGRKVSCTGTTSQHRPERPSLPQTSPPAAKMNRSTPTTTKLEPAPQAEPAKRGWVMESQAPTTKTATNPGTAAKGVLPTGDDGSGKADLKQSSSGIEQR